MIRVKTFTNELKIFQTTRELEQLDEQVNKFLAGRGIKRVISVSDAATTDDKGATQGIIRVVAYESE